MTEIHHAAGAIPAAMKMSLKRHAAGGVSRKRDTFYDARGRKMKIGKYSIDKLRIVTSALWGLALILMTRDGMCEWWMPLLDDFMQAPSVKCFDVCTPTTTVFFIVNMILCLIDQKVVNVISVLFSLLSALYYASLPMLLTELYDIMGGLATPVYKYNGIGYVFLGCTVLNVVCEIILLIRSSRK